MVGEASPSDATTEMHKLSVRMQHATTSTSTATTSNASVNHPVCFRSRYNRPQLGDAIKAYFVQVNRVKTLGASFRSIINGKACITFQRENIARPNRDANSAAKNAQYVRYQDARGQHWNVGQNGQRQDEGCRFLFG